MLDLSESEQVLIARTFFISLITDVIRIHLRKKSLHPRVLSYAYDTIAHIEKWKNISVFLLSIPWFIGRLKDDIIANQLLIDGSIHIEKAIQLINDNLKSTVLTVRWLANQLQISTTHLTNLFKLQLDETVSAYITKRKMTEITFELTYTNQSLKEIREKYGYLNHSNFIQSFKKHIGMTPLKYLQELHNS